MPARTRTAETIDPETLPAVFPVLTASRVLGIGKNTTYDLIRAGTYPVRVREICGRFKVTRYDLLRYLGASSPGVPRAGETAGQDGASGAADRSLRTVPGSCAPGNVLTSLMAAGKHTVPIAEWQSE